VIEWRLSSLDSSIIALDVSEPSDLRHLEEVVRDKIIIHLNI
jgi:hypothetical protein